MLSSYVATTEEAPRRRARSASLAEQFRPVLRGVPRGVDFASLNVFFRAGFFPGTSTAWRGVSVEPLILPQVTETSLTRDQVIDGYIDLFRSAIARCIRRSEGNVCMGLSGGRDSRHILLELCRQNAAPDLAWTIDVANANEADIARELADYARVPHLVLPATYTLADEARKNEMTHYSSDQHGWIMRCAEATSGYGTVYDGIAGDVLSESRLLTKRNAALLEQGRIDEFAEGIVHEQPCLDPVLFPRVDALHIVQQEARKYLHYPSPATVFWLCNRTRRDIAASAHWLIGRGKRVMTPFLDDTVAEFLLSLPARMLLGHNLHTDAIARAYPECRIPFAEKQAMPPRIIRRIAVEGLVYGISRRVGIVQQWRAMMRLVKSALMPGRYDASYLARQLVWCSGLKWDSIGY